MDPTNKSSTISTPAHEEFPSHPYSDTKKVENPINQLRELSQDHVQNKIDSRILKNIKSENTNSNYDEIITFQNFIDHKPKINDDILRFGSNEKNALYKSLPFATTSYANKYGLTLVEAAAIRAYSQNDFYIHINNQFRTLDLEHVDISDASALKKAGVKTNDLAELIAALIRGLRKLPPAQTSESYFTSLGRNVSLPLSELDLYTQDAEVVASTLLSTTNSADEMVIDNWWDNKEHALFIYQKVNGNGRDISMFSEFKKESEILFLPFTKFKVIFRGEPALTKPGVYSTGEPTNPNYVDKRLIKKILISIQEM